MVRIDCSGSGGRRRQCADEVELVIVAVMVTLMTIVVVAGVDHGCYD